VAVVLLQTRALAVNTEATIWGVRIAVGALAAEDRPGHQIKHQLRHPRSPCR
jgi:hypothetical protein